MLLSWKNAVLLQQDEMESKNRGKTNVFACTNCCLPAGKAHSGELLISSILSKLKYLHGTSNKGQACIIPHSTQPCHRNVPDGYRSGELEEVCILSCILNIRCHYTS